MGRPLGSKNKKSYVKEDEVKEFIKKANEDLNNHLESDTVLKQMRCKECDHLGGMHYGTTDRNCNVNGCECVIFKGRSNE